MVKTKCRIFKLKHTRSGVKTAVNLGENMKHITAIKPGGRLDNTAIILLDIFLQKNIGSNIEISLNNISKKRSRKENSYYWGCVIQYFRLGWAVTQGERITKDQAHEALKFKFLGKLVSVTGDLAASDAPDITITPTTKELASIDFQLYLQDAIDFVRTYFDIEIPPPEVSGHNDTDGIEELILQAVKK